MKVGTEPRATLLRCMSTRERLPARQDCPPPQQVSEPFTFLENQTFFSPLVFKTRHSTHSQIVHFALSLSLSPLSLSHPAVLGSEKN